MSERPETAAGWLPRYEFSEHHTIAIDAPPTAVERALRSVSLADIPAVRLLWWLRSLPGRVLLRTPATAASEPLLAQLARRGVLLVDRPGRVVIGLGGQFWQLSGGVKRFSTPAEFDAWDAHGSCKATIEFVWSDTGPVRLETTTRVHAPTASARRSFTRYWRLIRHGSALTRIALLRAVKRRAEAAQ